MRVLIVKMSSMGDVIHTLPALTDAGCAIKDITFDWVVEENFQEIPAWHPLVKRTIPISLRRWRKNLFSKTTRDEWRLLKNSLRENTYDLIIDAQGLLKSAVISRLAKGTRVGLDRESARESFAAYFYQKKIAVEKKQHAITRIRSLFAQALGYQIPETVPEYGLDRNQFRNTNANTNNLVFLHGTTWPTKHWPENYWKTLAKLAAAEGHNIQLAWGNEQEHERAKQIAAVCPQVEVLPKMNLSDMASVLATAQAVVSVDTGLGHLAAALDVPMISLYGPTDPELTGMLGRSQKQLRANFPCSPCLSRDCIFKNAAAYQEQPPCFTTLPPELVWNEVKKLFYRSSDK